MEGIVWYPAVTLPENPRKVEEEFQLMQELQAHDQWERASRANDYNAQAAWDSKQICPGCRKNYLVNFPYVRHHRMRMGGFCNLCDYGHPDEDYGTGYKTAYRNYQDHIANRTKYIPEYMLEAIEQYYKSIGGQDEP